MVKWYSDGDRPDESRAGHKELNVPQISFQNSKGISGHKDKGVISGDDVGPVATKHISGVNLEVDSLLNVKDLGVKVNDPKRHRHEEHTNEDMELVSSGFEDEFVPESVNPTTKNDFRVL